jgi:L-histidine Nalpha-methyltransferase
MPSGVTTTIAPLVDEQVVQAALAGLHSFPKRLPPWLFYDEAGSRLFEAITELPEYYLTRTERSILARHAGAMVEHAAAGQRLRIAELGAGSAEKTRLLLHAAVERQNPVLYEPIDVSVTALLAAQSRIEREVPGVRVQPLVMDYTNGFHLDPLWPGERRLVLYIGSSIGNFEPDEAARLLEHLRTRLEPGDSLLLGVDLVKDPALLLAAYDDAAGVTAAFNKNILVRLNRELGADFRPDSFTHRAVWNPTHSRIEMHLESRCSQRIRLAALCQEIDQDNMDRDHAEELVFAAGETIHTENSYKYRPGQPEALLAQTGFAPAASWSDEQGWFQVCLGVAQ